MNFSIRVQRYFAYLSFLFLIFNQSNALSANKSDWLANEFLNTEDTEIAWNYGEQIYKTGKDGIPIF